MYSFSMSVQLDPMVARYPKILRGILGYTYSMKKRYANWKDGRYLTWLVGYKVKSTLSREHGKRHNYKNWNEVA